MTEADVAATKRIIFRCSCGAQFLPHKTLNIVGASKQLGQKGWRIAQVGGSWALLCDKCMDGEK